MTQGDALLQLAGDSSVERAPVSRAAGVRPDAIVVDSTLVPSLARQPEPVAHRTWLWISSSSGLRRPAPGRPEPSRVSRRQLIPVD